MSATHPPMGFGDTIVHDRYGIGTVVVSAKGRAEHPYSVQHLIWRPQRIVPREA
jgi:hypothetical protein